MSKRIDLTGMRFGRLVVTGYAGDLKWFCACDCGASKTVLGTSLRGSLTKSCGCYCKEVSGSNRKLDLTGQVFGRLTAIKFSGHRNQCRLWECKCECGNTAHVPTAVLRNGATRSCGCLSNDMLALRNFKHGGSADPEYWVLHSMLERCRNPNNKFFSIYGGRGIFVCDRWLNYDNFLADMGRRPSPKHSIDRIDNDGNYEPSNCRWATATEQARNKSNNRRITAFGKTKCVSDWCSEYGIAFRTIMSRLNLGWSPEAAVSTQPKHRRAS